MNHRKLLSTIGFIGWSGFVVAAYFVVHKPLVLQVASQLINTAWAFLVTLILLGNALALGLLIIRQCLPDAMPDPSILALACGLGLGALGLLGFVFAATGVKDFFILLAAQLILLSWAAWRGLLQSGLVLFSDSLVQIRSSLLLLPRWMRWAVIIAVVLTFFRTLLPPADAFDALLYHLTVPELWLQDGGLRAYDIPHYWFPGLIEGIYFWGLGLGSDLVSQQIHFAYALCTMVLVWNWTRRLWDDLTAGWALMFLISMPSLLLLASWAYTDLALIFFGLGMLYTLVQGKEQSDPRFWTLSAISAGMAMGVKYTSFVMPVTAVLLLVSWSFQRKRELFTNVFRFGLISTVTGVIWYVRNWIWMWNPIYPFLFGGRYWDEFRALWFATPGTGLGWDIGALVLLPLTITLGYQDINSIDADIGPLLLLALPLALGAIFRKANLSQQGRIAFTAIGFFALFSAAFWTYGYITTRDLWQTRLLLPAMVPFVIPMAVGMLSLRGLDTKYLRLDYIVSVIAAISIFINLLNAGLSVIARNPLGIAAGLMTGQSYLEKYQPGYAYVQRTVSETPLNSKIYFLFEPRSYGMSRSVQPDPILDNFAHDLYLHGNPDDIISTWQRQGYTHVLLNRKAADFILEEVKEKAIFDASIVSLKSVSKSPDGSYELLEIPENVP